MNESTDKTDVKSNYAQLVSSVINQYDATLIFHEVQPVQAKPDDVKNFKTSIKEVARITLSHKSLNELSELLARQVKEMKGKK